MRRTALPACVLAAAPPSTCLLCYIKQACLAQLPVAAESGGGSVKLGLHALLAGWPVSSSGCMG